jgi:hypothetical protein
MSSLELPPKSQGKSVGNIAASSQAAILAAKIVRPSCCGNRGENLSKLTGSIRSQYAQTVEVRAALRGFQDLRERLRPLDLVRGANNHALVLQPPRTKILSA